MAQSTQTRHWAGVFARSYAGDAEGEAYHGPALRRMLDGVTPAVAAARPIASAHTIWEIVIHLAAWRELVAKALEGRKGTIAHEGWVRVRDEGAPAWREALSRLDASQHRLLRGVQALDPPRMRAHEERLRFLLHHDLYHAGQIGLLRKAAAKD
jgi:hypothetical protein